MVCIFVRKNCRISCFSSINVLVVMHRNRCTMTTFQSYAYKESHGNQILCIYIVHTRQLPKARCYGFFSLHNVAGSANSTFLFNRICIYITETKRAIPMKNEANFLFTFPCCRMREHKMCQH